ncbi:unnamed protein product [Thelazia callipaeda]|uniref:Presenilin n=1 Tax=Thelazia callipaeda TaxID=103827 RepID=A0A0N5CMR2_THECL|nr:unnamed protein product [Thelazia callipaeda]
MFKVENQIASDDVEILMLNLHNVKVERLLIPVTLNILLTLSVWIGVYRAKTDSNSVFYYMLDPEHNRTTGNEVIDGLVNGIGCVFMLAIISFALLGMALYDYKRLVQMWLYMSCVLIIFGVFSSFLVDLFKALGFETAPPVFTILIVAAYGSIGIIVFFTKRAPLYMHQFYVICNCSLVSVFYLRMFPTHTAWFVLVCIIIWDAFAVLAPFGPLRRINEKAHEYSDQVLRFLMFTAQDRSDSLQDETIDENIRLRKTASPERDIQAKIVERNCQKVETFIKLANEERKYTVYDALNDASIRLGMGDFVFYSLLVGKAAASQSAMCVLGSAVGILVGLVVTLTVLSNEEETTPALPVSITVALLLHFGIYLFVEPFYQQIVTCQRFMLLL